MKKTTLSLLITSALTGLSGAAHAQSPLTMQELAQKTFERIEEVKTLAANDEGTFIRDGRKFINYKGREYWVNFDNYPKFPLQVGGEEAAYRHILDFIDNSWEFVWYDGGFYLLNLDYGVMNRDMTGCFIEYVPASRGSVLPNGEFAYESDMVQNVEMSDCAGLTLPEMSNLAVSSLSDTGVSIDWIGQSETDTTTLTLKSVTGEIVSTYHVSEPGFFLGNLSPETAYSVEINTCNALGCALPQSVSFTTLPSRLGYADTLPATNHLIGELAGGIGFAQTHTTTAPYGNEEKQYPDLVIDREALLLLTPEDPSINQLWVEIYQNGELLARNAMLPPSALAGTDQPDNGRPEVIFSHKAWSLPLQWDWMKPGLSLVFSDNQGRSGELTQDMLVFGGAPELVIQNIDIGMLTPPRGMNTMIQNMPPLAADYFQKIPVSKLVMADYAPAFFPEITLPNGKVYTESSDGEGGWHGGDMREAIGKALVSTGINNANVGITDTAGYSQAYNRRFNHISAHTNVGIYTNGTITHGGSGGGGIVTLTATTGNEWSHELGHNYGLGHFPHQASTHDLESGWGWDALHRRFIGNLHWQGKAATNDVGGEVVPPFAGEYRFTRDAMAGGEAAKLGTISHYTLMHSAQNRRIQGWLNSGFNLDASSPSGYVKWNPVTHGYDNAETDTPAPVQTGVPVITLVGVYDPRGDNPSQIYPPLYSNYGNLFDLPAPEISAFHPEGWQPVTMLTAEQIAADTWQTMMTDGSLRNICQFSFNIPDGETVQFVGAETTEETCSAGSDMYWSDNGNRVAIESAPGDYSLLSRYGVGSVTYTPSSTVGEVQLCALNKGGTSHDGAGYVSGGYCQQLPGVKHSNGRDWRYALHQGGINQPTFTEQGQCNLSVEKANGTRQDIALSAFRHNGNQSNKFHFNIPWDAEPSRITLTCTNANGERELDTLYPEHNPSAGSLSGPVIIGQDHGYTDVIDKREVFADNPALISLDFGSFADFDRYVAEHYGAGILNNGDTVDSRMVGALYVFPNPVTGSRDYFLMRSSDAGDMPLNQASNNGWKYLGSADNYVNLSFNPIRLVRGDATTEERVSAYFDQSRLLTSDERLNTGWGSQENAVFVSDRDANGDKSYFIQKRPGAGGEFPVGGQSDADWHYLGNDADIEALVAELNSDSATFEQHILDWYKQDRMREWGDNGTNGTVNDIYVYHFRGGIHYYRLKDANYWYFPWPTGENPNNADWEYLGRF